MLQLLCNLGVHMLPGAFNDISQFDCSCPEYRARGLGALRNPEPCKHGMGLFYALAKELDLDPAGVFKLRSFTMPSSKWVAPGQLAEH